MALPEEYTTNNPGLVEKGCENLLAHIEIIRKSGVSPVVCLNAFTSDTKEAIATARRIAVAAGARCAVSDVWAKGGDGARELAAAVVDACEDESDFRYLSDDAEPMDTRIEKIAREVYGADGVSYSEEAKAQLAALMASPDTAVLPICMAKTQYSLSHDPALLGRPKVWTLPIRSIMSYCGAGWVVPVCGDIKLMPGTTSNPAFRRINVDTTTGDVLGIM